MQMAMAVGDCSAEDADLLRRAMGSKRGIERIESVRERLYAGMARNGLTGEAADAIYRQILAFADFGFAESHSLSFALLVYASAWLKLRHPAAFLAGLLDSQPMGFYSPATLVADARRHGVRVRKPDINASAAGTTLEPVVPSARDDAAAGRTPPGGPGRGVFAVRLGLAGVRGLGADAAAAIAAERERGGPYRSIADVSRRSGASEAQLTALASAGAFTSLGLDRRQSIWQAGAAARDRPDTLAGSTVVYQPPLFTDESAFESLAADLLATGVSTTDHPMVHVRAALAARGALTIPDLATHEPGRRVEVAGLVTHRQRPSTASGITFLSLEDEHGLVNVVCSPGLWKRYRRAARGAQAVVVRGLLERSPEGVVSLVADRIEQLPLGLPHRSRDFR